MSLRILASCIVPFALSLGVTGAAAQGYPVKPVRILVGFAGGSELTARMVAQLLSPALGQQVIVEPRMGAAGGIAFEAAARSAPDGYTLLMGAVPLLTNPLIYPKVNYEGMRDFTPIVLLSTIPNGLFLHPSVPAKTLRELTQLARKSPGKIAYGSGGVGSANHIAVAFLESPYLATGDACAAGDTLLGVKRSPIVGPLWPFGYPEFGHCTQYAAAIATTVAAAYELR